MRWWFGRKAAPDARPFVPAWLTAGDREGFARSVPGLTAFVKSTGVTLRFGSSGWEQALGPKQPAIPDAAGGTTVDSEARSAIAAMLAAMRSHGLIAV